MRATIDLLRCVDVCNDVKDMICDGQPAVVAVASDNTASAAAAASAAATNAVRDAVKDATVRYHSVVNSWAPRLFSFCPS